MKTGAGWLDLRTFVMGTRLYGGQSLNLTQWRAPGQVAFLVTILSSSIKVISHTKPRRLHLWADDLRVDWVTTEPGYCSIVLKPMHWEHHYCLIPNEPLQAGLDVMISWMHGCCELCSLISKCVRYSKHIYFVYWLFTRAQDCLEVYSQTTGKTAGRKLSSQVPVARLIRSWRVISSESKWIGFRV